jgi:hypothetical protein
MPSLRAGLDAAQRECVAQLVLAWCDTSWAYSPCPGKRVADHAEPGGAVPLHGPAAPNSLAA